jgi:two-component system KDP operon response regulator KdpE
MDTNSLLRILVVDDERPIRRFLSSALGSTYDVFEAETGMEALQKVAVNRPDVIILDLGLPDLDGLEVTRRLREWTLVPIIVVSVRDGENDKINALDAGADDYLTKPFDAGELMARIRAALRHSNKPENEPFYESGDLVINLALRQVLVNHQPVTLTPTEYEIMRALVTHAGRVMTHAQIIQAVWSGNDVADSHLLRVNISNLRKKIEKDPLRPLHIVTEPGVGFRLREIEGSK